MSSRQQTAPAAASLPPYVRGAGAVATEAAAYAHCAALVASHYENFPVASRLLPRELRPHVAAVYAFARTADDFADEARFEGERMERLEAWEQALLRAAAGEVDLATDPIFVAVAATIRDRDLPVEPLRDLITAFRRDVTTRRHATWDDLLDYCRYSANPVGRLVLLLSGIRDPETHALSDCVCTALQLANFWQDVAVDLEKDRIYLPREDRERFGVGEDDLRARRATPGVRALIGLEVERTRALFRQGRGVVDRVGRRLGFELRLTWLGGMRILDKVEAQGFDTLSARPALGKRDWAALAARAALGGRLR